MGGHSGVMSKLGSTGLTVASANSLGGHSGKSKALALSSSSFVTPGILYSLPRIPVSELTSAKV